MPEDSQTIRIAVGGKRVKLPESAHAEIQEMLDQCLDRHAIAKLREVTQCGHEEACDALADPSNFSQDAREALIAERASQAKPQSPGLGEKLASQAGAVKQVTDTAKALVGSSKASSNAPLKLIAAGVILAIAIAIFVVFSVDSGPRTIDVYYYDMTNGTTFVGQPAAVVPVAAPGDSGDARSGMRAYVFSCGSCSDESERFVGYIERQTEAYNDYLLRLKRGEAAPAAPGEDDGEPRIRTPEGGEWVRESSAEAARIMKDAANRCSGSRATPCFP